MPGRAEPRLHRIAVENEAVDALAEGPVAERLDVGWVTLPFLAVVGSEGLGTDNLLAVDVGG